MDILEIMDIMDVMDITDRLNIMDPLEIIDIMNIINITAWMAMTGADSALVYCKEEKIKLSLSKIPHTGDKASLDRCG